MTGCVHRRVITEDLNRKASSAIGDFFIVVANIWVGFVAFKALFFASKQTASLLRPKCLRKPQLVQRSTPTGPLGQRSTLSGPHGQRSTLHRPSRPAEHLSGPHGQRSTPAPALSASGAPLRPSRPAEHPCTGPLGQRSTSPALTASGAPLHRPSRPAERLYRPLPGQRSAFRCQL
ncbi:uncharacterized protein LOC133850795 [Drosophila sulfurigaster albostrigata]|uniref:uncharacterized protein LOC133850795 n=1 Tax=Drosophila sulfurigaster albostrigata TaxID=89887 RepID=UPI002D21E27C|nr:uncharacterized protein LOC133850795 [Drosophila sulfurigaster albostrigata]